MNTSLRHALEDLAEGHDFTPDPSAWDRGRRARRRDRAVLVAAVLVLVASLGGIGVLVERQTSTPVADGSGDGWVPARLHRVPDRLVQHDTDGSSWDDRVGSSDLAIGRGAVAFLGGGVEGLPVVVDADDGTHHLLDLPGWIGAGPLGLVPLGEGPGLALSPDGTRLAWAYGLPAAGRTDYTPVATGIRIADLRTGDVTEARLYPLMANGQAVLAHTLAWSPDGATLGWRAVELSQWNASGSSANGPEQQGLVDVATGRLQRIEIPALDHRSVTIAVTDDGALVLRSGRREWAWRDGRVLGASDSYGPAFGIRAPGAGVYDTDVDVRQLGWVDGDHVAALVTPQGGSTPQLVVMTSSDVPEDEASWRIAARWDVGPGNVAGVAVDLLGLGEGTPGVTGLRDFPAPRWPWSDEQKAVVALLGLLGAAAGLVLVRGLVGRR